MSYHGAVIAIVKREDWQYVINVFHQESMSLLRLLKIYNRSASPIHAIHSEVNRVFNARLQGVSSTFYANAMPKTAQG